MFEGQYLHQNGEGFSVYSPWFPKGGANAQFTLDLIQAKDTEIGVEVFTKNTEDTGEAPGTAAASLAATNSEDQHQFGTTSANLKELVRYKFTASPKSGASPGFVLFRMLAPVWFDAVDA